ncbi:MAG: hypothetical protein PHG14_09995 [Desulfobacter postgatei]|uniref:hypothetical protein n=1 Tax=Desulfobacter postgatei TaxID=2293 RepID=UPI0023F0F4B4|nr:hypothetical protein [Desulfobacter postgatei]MDD4274042.1 hypothetical protein [Desulfobacter postgatei]
MSQKNSIAPLFYLPFKNFHIAPVYGITPDLIKKSAQDLITDREQIKHTTRLNSICKLMGFTGGFSHFTQEYTRELEPFLKTHGLKVQSDLITPRLACANMPAGLVNQSNLADRLFNSNKPLPQKIFTGYDFDFNSRYDDGFYYFHTFGNKIYKKRPRAFRIDWNEWISWALEEPDLIISKRDRWPDRKLIDFVLGGFMLDIHSAFNLLGNALVHPMEADDNFVIKRYYALDAPSSLEAETTRQIKAVYKLFRSCIEQSQSGWVNVIQYNRNLIFLKGKNGEYTFLVRGLRLEKFEHNIFRDYLKNADVPKQNGQYHFQRWFYFEYKGWEEQDEHKAEKLHYASGDTDYPGVLKINKNYFVHKGLYRFENKAGKPNDRFTTVNLNGQKYYVSNLVTIEDFQKFSTENPDYFNYRKGDQLFSVNTDPCHMPAAVTWFDANAYASWFQKEHHLPVRLLTAAEYRALIESDPSFQSMKNKMDELFSGNRDEIEEEEVEPYKMTSDLHFYYPDGTEIFGTPPYMPQDTFQDLIYVFKKEVQWRRHESGLSFIQSDQFSEWLNDNKGSTLSEAINTKRYTSARSFSSVELYPFPADSTGKYKYQKIGFRLCYLGTD